MDEAERLEAGNKDEAILALLGRLALVYWRPDFTPSQAKQLYQQYLEDLREFPMAEIAQAIQKYRRDGANTFFPAPGQLRELIATPPSWDTISKNEHIRALHSAARDEMASRAAETRKRLGQTNTLKIEAA